MCRLALPLLGGGAGEVVRLQAVTVLPRDITRCDEALHDMITRQLRPMSADVGTCTAVPCMLDCRRRGHRRRLLQFPLSQKKNSVSLSQVKKPKLDSSPKSGKKKEKIKLETEKEKKETRNLQLNYLLREIFAKVVS